MVKSFTVDRKRWQRGQDKGWLYGENRKMCCLGFLARACGYAVKDIKGLDLPSGCDAADDHFSEALLMKDSSIAAVNDNAALSDETREKTLRKQFKDIGVTVKFIN